MYFCIPELFRAIYIIQFGFNSNSAMQTSDNYRVTNRGTLEHGGIKQSTPS